MTIENANAVGDALRIMENKLEDADRAVHGKIEKAPLDPGQNARKRSEKVQGTHGGNDPNAKLPKNARQVTIKLINEIISPTSSIEYFP